MKNRNKLTLSALAVTIAFCSATCAFALNPQPEPPKEIKKGRLISPAEKKGLNPQPEPPKIIRASKPISSKGPKGLTMRKMKNDN